MCEGIARGRSVQRPSEELAAGEEEVGTEVIEGWHLLVGWLGGLVSSRGEYDIVAGFFSSPTEIEGVVAL